MGGLRLISILEPLDLSNQQIKTLKPVEEGVGVGYSTVKKKTLTATDVNKVNKNFFLILLKGGILGFSGGGFYGDVKFRGLGFCSDCVDGVFVECFCGCSY